jgi:hypothetical protein
MHGHAGSSEHPLPRSLARASKSSVRRSLLNAEAHPETAGQSSTSACASSLPLHGRRVGDRPVGCGEDPGTEVAHPHVLIRRARGRRLSCRDEQQGDVDPTTRRPRPPRPGRGSPRTYPQTPASDSPAGVRTVGHVRRLPVGPSTTGPGVPSRTEVPGRRQPTRPRCRVDKEAKDGHDARQCHNSECPPDQPHRVAHRRHPSAAGRSRSRLYDHACVAADLWLTPLTRGAHRTAPPSLARQPLRPSRHPTGLSVA